MSPIQRETLRKNVEELVVRERWVTAGMICHKLKIPRHDTPRHREVDRALQYLKKEGVIYFSKVKRAWVPILFEWYHLKCGHREELRPTDECRLHDEKPCWKCDNINCVAEVRVVPEAPKPVSRLPKDVFEVGDYAVILERNGYEKVYLVRVVQKNKRSNSIYVEGRGTGTQRFSGDNGSRIPGPGPMGIPFFTLVAFDPKKHEFKWFDPQFTTKGEYTAAHDNLVERNERLAKMREEGR